MSERKTDEKPVENERKTDEKPVKTINNINKENKENNEKKDTGRGVDFDLTPQGLAQLFLSRTRKLNRSGYGASESVQSVTAVFEEIDRLGHGGENLKKAILDEKRDRAQSVGEFRIWMQKQGYMPDALAKPKAKIETASERLKRLKGEA